MLLVTEFVSSRIKPCPLELVKRLSQRILVYKEAHILLEGEINKKVKGYDGLKRISRKFVKKNQF